MATHEGYCVKCRGKKEIKSAKSICPVCGTKMNRMLGAKK